MAFGIKEKNASENSERKKERKKEQRNIFLQRAHKWTDNKWILCIYLTRTPGKLNKIA